MVRRKASSRTMVLLLIAVLVLGIYVLPSATAKFAGSHTWEFNASTGVTGLKCGKCHVYIVSEINNSNAKALAGNAITAHLNASNATEYIGKGKPLNFSGPGATWDATYDNVCWMCHVVEGGASVSGTHTRVTIRVCTDVDCHGNYNNQSDDGGTVTSCDIWGEDHCNVTGRINNTADAHRNFYYPLTRYTSPYGNENGGQYDYGFVACLACHTHVGLDLNFTRPNKLSARFNLTAMTGSTQTSPWNITKLEVNTSSTNTTVGGKAPGSVWY